MNALQIEHLVLRVQPHFWTPHRTILADVSLTVASGDIFGFLGPNGAGKTTTIKSSLGLIRPTAGRIEIFGRPPHENAVRRRIGFMPEQAYFPDHLTARELLLQHGLLAGLSPRNATRRADEILELVGIARAGRAPLGTYSKGMLQRVGLGQAIVGNPNLVILDEPMSGLDPFGRRDIRELMVELRRQGKTIFFSTHILPDVEMICDRVAIIASGTTRKVGRLTDLLGEAVHGVEVETEACDPTQLGEEARLITSSEARGTAMLLRCATIADANRLIDALRRQGTGVRGMQVLRRSLEELFVSAALGERRTERPQ